ncbi:hypothetical protein [Brevibacillus borstelensis]|uniref:hypothetical protein n=1 Tax=Brevibacillus borstelensis TaxID=45462 RepID=UPI001D0A2A27|nr:hypothetical protein [Brevibacillus borstelensis]MCC0564213.1 hypothetical protein [Brevibacillus borstelensis]
MSMQIAFYYDSSFDWNDNDLENKGVGGSQSTLIRMTRELAKRHEVTVFNSTTKEGRYNGVTYRNYQTYRSDQFWDVFVSYRCALPSSGVNAACKLHWCIDPGDNTVEKDLPFIDKVITISPFHTKMMSNIFHIDKSKIYEARLGIQTEDYWDCLPKTKNKLIFCSAPDRGLRHVPQIFSLIKKRYLMYRSSSPWITAYGDSSLKQNRIANCLREWRALPIWEKSRSSNWSMSKKQA